MSQALSTEERLELLAELAEGTVSVDALEEGMLEQLAEELGTAGLAALIASSPAAAPAGSPRNREDLAPDRRAIDAPAGRIGPPVALPRWLGVAAVLALVVGGAALWSVATRRPTAIRVPDATRNLAAPLAWATPLRGRSGLLDRPAAKNRDAALDAFLRSDAFVTDAVEPQTVDVDGDGEADAVVFGLTTIKDTGTEPWLIAVFVGPAPQVPALGSLARWGPRELAGAGLTSALISRRDGAHAVLLLSRNGELQSLHVDTDADGRCDRAWTKDSDPPGGDSCSGPLLDVVADDLRALAVDLVQASAEPVGLPVPPRPSP